MHPALPLLLLLLADPLLPAGPVDISADAMTFDRATGQTRAVGHATVVTGTIVLRAPSLTRDPAHGILAIDGPLFAIDGQNLLIAQRAIVSLGEPAAGPPNAAPPERAVDLFGVELVQKEGVTTAALAAARTPDEALALGKSDLLIFADHLERLGPAHYRMERLELTPCNFAKGCTPAWSLTAAHADVEAGARALLSWPVFRADGLPVLPLPALYIPLAQRQTGFLLPHLAWQVQNGLIVDEPFFLTLGPSYDLTLSPGYVTGQSEAGLGAFGVQGPRASAEFRYAPDRGTAGRIAVSVLDDQHHDPALGTTFPGSTVPPTPRGLRGSLHEWQLQDLDDRVGDRLDLSLVSDAALTSQLTTDILYASIPATRSAASLFRRGDDWLVSGSSVVMQDFQGAFAPENVHQELFGPGSPRTLAATPRLEADLADERLGASPFWASLESSIVREAPLGSTYDLVTLGPALPNALGAPTSPALPGRVAADRIDVLPTITLPLLADRFATASASASWREDLWLFEGPPLPPGMGGPPLGQVGERGYPILDATAATSLSRPFSEGDKAWTHSITPGVEGRWLPFIQASGTVPPLWLLPNAGPGGAFVLDHATGLPIAAALPLPYDELDFAPGFGATPTGAPGSILQGQLPQGLAQGKVDLDQRLHGPRGQSFRLDVGEYLDPEGLDATFALAQAVDGPFRASGHAVYSARPLPCPGCDPAGERLRRLSEASADLSFTDARGDTVGGNFVRAVAGGSAILSTPADALYASLPGPQDPRWSLPDVSQAAVNGAVKVTQAVTVHGGLVYLLPAELPIQLLTGAGYRSPQGCWALDANLVLQPPLPGEPLGIAAFFVTFDLGQFGGGAL